MERSAEGTHSLRSILLVAGFEDRCAQGKDKGDRIDRPPLARR
jgi:hypothetical protein